MNVDQFRYFYTFFIKVQFQATQRVRVGIDLTVDTIHLDEIDNTLGMNFHIKVYVAIIIYITIRNEMNEIIYSYFSKVDWFESSRVEFQNLKKHSKNFVSLPQNNT